jgi:hypothetical protein
MYKMYLIVSDIQADFTDIMLIGAYDSIQNIISDDNLLTKFQEISDQHNRCPECDETGMFDDEVCGECGGTMINPDAEFFTKFYIIEVDINKIVNSTIFSSLGNISDIPFDENKCILKFSSKNYKTALSKLTV